MSVAEPTPRWSVSHLYATSLCSSNSTRSYQMAKVWKNNSNPPWSIFSSLHELETLYVWDCSGQTLIWWDKQHSHHRQTSTILNRCGFLLGYSSNPYVHVGLVLPKDMYVHIPVCICITICVCVCVCLFVLMWWWRIKLELLPNMLTFIMWAKQLGKEDGIWFLLITPPPQYKFKISSSSDQICVK